MTFGCTPAAATAGPAIAAGNPRNLSYGYIYRRKSGVKVVSFIKVTAALFIAAITQDRTAAVAVSPVW
jgi:hypothetical protein